MRRTWNRRALLLGGASALLACGGGKESPRRAPDPKQTPGTQGLPRSGDAFRDRIFHDEAGFDAIPLPGPTDWLASHKVKEQSFEDFVAAKRRPVDKDKQVLELLPVGPASKREVDAAALQAHVEAFFQMKVRVRDRIPVDLEKVREREHGGRQLHAGDILDWLEELRSKDAYATLAYTNVDLYPEEDWNFVFGYARASSGTGVFSFNRFRALPEHDMAGSYDMDQVMRLRVYKVLTHEIGHTFGLSHCVHYSCGMQGSNNLDETDREPPHLCPVCLAKLEHSINFDPVTRYEALRRSWTNSNLPLEAKWVEGRLNYIETRMRAMT